MNASRPFSMPYVSRCSGRRTAAVCAASLPTTYFPRAALLERSAGFSHAEAVGLAVLAMGEPHALGLRLRRSRFPLRGLLLTLLTCLVWTAIAACLLYLLCRV